MGRKQWVVGRPDPRLLAPLLQAGYSRILSALLVNRGIFDADKAALFLSCEGELHDALLLADMERAARRVLRAVAEGTPIVVYGDYDVDGVTATALLSRYLREAGARVRTYIPDRETEGYGLNPAAAEKIAAAGAGLVITVDTGVSAFDEAALLKSRGVDVIITDHHEPRDALPDAYALVDPKRAEGSYPFRELAGVGVAFKLVCAVERLAGGMDADALFARYGGLVCLGTVADVVPLRGENRVLVGRGLALLREKGSPVLDALLQAAGMAGREPTAGILGFTVAPRINACGRMGSADDALRLLTARDGGELHALAGKLDANNRRRQAAEGEILAEALAQLAADPQAADAPVIFAAGENWHPGVIGIVAARLTELYGRPAVVASFEGEIGKASCRSVEGFHMHRALQACAQLLERFGGHALAAGFTVRRENYGALRGALLRFAQELPERPAARLRLECELAPEEIGLAAAEDAARLEPCGCGNPAPLFYIGGAVLEAAAPVGGGNHLRLSFQRNGRRFTAMLFGLDRHPFAYRAGDRLDLAAETSVNVFRGKRSLTLIVRDERPSEEPDPYEELYRGYIRSGGLPDGLGEETLRALCPVRRDFVAVYRCLLAAGREEISLRETCARAGGLTAGFQYFKLRVILDVFEEMRLIRCEIAGDRCRFRIDRTVQFDLARSGVLRKIRLASGA